MSTSIAERIKFVRTEILDKTQEELGRMLGLTRPAVSQWEKAADDEITIKLSNVVKIATAGHVSIDWLLTGAGEGPSSAAPALSAPAALDREGVLMALQTMAEIILQPLADEDPSVPLAQESRALAEAVLGNIETHEPAPRGMDWRQALQLRVYDLVRGFPARRN